MGLRHLPQTSALLLALVAPWEASQYCGRLYWNPDRRFSSCLQRFGPPPYPDHEFVENCGLNDFGDHLTHPFKKCSGLNLDFAELCTLCNSGALATTPAGSRGKTQRRSREVLVRLRRAGPGLTGACLPELAGLETQPLSHLLDELEVLEKLIVLLDPEPGPGGGMAYGTTWHPAVRYAAWSTFVYSLQPSRSPLQALIEIVVARELSATLGQLSEHLVQLGWADALQVLSRLGWPGICGGLQQSFF
ncbi:LOW QUALITY PROTEIN: IGF-like family receptor 1 [Erethizon dorsatum]